MTTSGQNTNTVAIHPVLAKVTSRIAERSQTLRAEYLVRLEQMRHRGPRRASLSCANQAHANAAADTRSKIWLNQAYKEIESVDV